MKKTILLFIVALLFTGCIAENMDDCGGVLNLTFSHGNSTEEFDHIIGNDVRVYLYKEDKLHQVVEVPYEKIKGGQKYRIRKTFSGKMDIAAWAIPQNGKPEMIPDKEEHAFFSTSTLKHREQTYADQLSVCEPLDDLFLGVVSAQDESLSTESNYLISMRNTVCKVNVFAESTLFESVEAKGDPLIHLGGCSRGATLALKPFGEEVCIKTGFNEVDKEGLISTNPIGLMPSCENKTISVTAFKGNTELFRINTEEFSEPGKEITIIIKGMTAEIKVNGWRVRVTSIIFK